MYLEAVIELVWRCAWRLRLSELRDALGGWDRARLEMQLDTKRWSKLRDVLGSRDRASLEMHLEAEIE
jgi:hypothetical protein